MKKIQLIKITLLIVILAEEIKKVSKRKVTIRIDSDNCDKGLYYNPQTFVE